MKLSNLVTHLRLNLPLFMIMGTKHHELDLIRYNGYPQIYILFRTFIKREFFRFSWSSKITITIFYITYTMLIAHDDFKISYMIRTILNNCEEECIRD